MKKLVILLLAFMLIFSLSCSAKTAEVPAATPAETPATTEAPATPQANIDANLRVGTGGTQGTYYGFTSAITNILKDKIPGLTFTVQSTGASKANILLIKDGEVDMAIVQNDVMDYAYNGTDLFAGEKIDGFKSLAGVYAEVCQVIAKPGINSIADLKGKKVSVGDVGSGVEFNAGQILGAYDLSFADIGKQNLSFGDSATAFKDGKIDAFFVTAGAPTVAVVELQTATDIKILEIDDEHAAKLIEKYPFYTQFAIPKDAYKGMEADVKTVAVKATFIVADSVAEDVVYALTKALFENKAELTVAHKKAAELDPKYAVEGISVPFHPGAEKYFKEVGALK